MYPVQETDIVDLGAVLIVTLWGIGGPYLMALLVRRLKFLGMVHR
jgi:hypothetical protein